MDNKVSVDLDKMTTRQADDEQARFSKRTIAFTLLGTMLVTFIATLDQTIVGTALPRIVADLHGFEQITWMTTIYLLTSTVTIPIYGKLSDLLGRKRIFLLGIVIFLLGSALSGAAQSMTQLVIFRALQGIGAGGLQPIATAVVGDLFPPRERGKWVGITSSSYALAVIIGPLAGGLLTDAVSWRWVFYVNLPIGLIAMVVLTLLMPPLHTTGRRIVIDYPGALLVVMVTLPLLLGFSWAGEQFAWLSWPSLGLFGGVCILLVVLIFYSVREERLGREPIVEPSMFKDVRVFSISLCATMLISVAMLGSVYFLPVFLQSVVSVSATDSGLALIPFALASIMGAIVNGLLITATGRYKWTALVATVIMIVGILLLLRLDIHARSLDVVGAVVVFGLGAGASLALYTVVVQNAMPSRIGQATSTLVFFRQLGQSIGLAALGGVVTTSYVPAFYRSLPPQLRESMPLVRAFENPLVLLSPQVMASIHSGFEHYGPQGQAAYNALLNAVKTGLTESIHQAFLLSLGLMLITLILVIFLKEIPLRSRKETS